MGRHRQVISALVLTGAVAFCGSAAALPILDGSTSGGNVWTASDAEGRIASATFTDISNGSTNAFQIQLENLASAADSRQPNQILVGVVFEFFNDPGIVDPSGDVFGVNVTGNILPSSTATFGTNLDGEFAFVDDLTGMAAKLGNYWVSSSAYDPLGLNPVINPAVAYHPTSTNGAGHGVAAVGANPVNGVKAWVDGSALIVLQTMNAFDLDDLKQVHFLYGTSFYDTPPPTTVPEPTPLWLLGAGLLALGFARRKRS